MGGFRGTTESLRALLRVSMGSSNFLGGEGLRVSMEWREGPGVLLWVVVDRRALSSLVFLRALSPSLLIISPKAFPTEARLSECLIEVRVEGLRCIAPLS